MYLESFEAITRNQAPLSCGLIDELLPFWARYFDELYGDFYKELQGSEINYNTENIYIMRAKNKLAGILRMTVSKSNSELAGIGVVATEKSFRGQGVATTICREAVADFEKEGGQCLFLVADKPGPRRIYHRLGWRKQGGTDVMSLITSGDSPEEFLTDYFRVGGQTTIHPGSPRDRVPMMPLHVTPHDWQVLDANVGEFSTRYWSGQMCNTVYPAYEQLASAGKGLWFSAYSDTNRLVGLSSALMTSSEECRIDGFTHHRYLDVWADLIQTATEWGTNNNASLITTRISIEDEHKRELFYSLGFRERGKGQDFQINERTLNSIIMGKEA